MVSMDQIRLRTRSAQDRAADTAGMCRATLRCGKERWAAIHFIPFELRDTGATLLPLPQCIRNLCFQDCPDPDQGGALPKDPGTLGAARIRPGYFLLIEVIRLPASLASNSKVTASPTAT